MAGSERNFILRALDTAASWIVSKPAGAEPGSNVEGRKKNNSLRIFSLPSWRRNSSESSQKIQSEAASSSASDTPLSSPARSHFSEFSQGTGHSQDDPLSASISLSTSSLPPTPTSSYFSRSSTLIDQSGSQLGISENRHSRTIYYEDGLRARDLAIAHQSQLERASNYAEKSDTEKTANQQVNKGGEPPFSLSEDEYLISSNKSKFLEVYPKNKKTIYRDSRKNIQIKFLNAEYSLSQSKDFFNMSEQLTRSMISPGKSDEIRSVTPNSVATAKLFLKEACKYLIYSLENFIEALALVKESKKQGVGKSNYDKKISSYKNKSSSYEKECSEYLKCLLNIFGVDRPSLIDELSSSKLSIKEFRRELGNFIGERLEEGVAANGPEHDLLKEAKKATDELRNMFSSSDQMDNRGQYKALMDELNLCCKILTRLNFGGGGTEAEKNRNRYQELFINPILSKIKGISVGDENSLRPASQPNLTVGSVDFPLGAHPQQGRGGAPSIRRRVSL